MDSKTGFNIFQGKKVRLRPKTIGDMEKELLKIENNEYDTEIDRLCDVIYLPNSAEVRRASFESDTKAFNTWERCSLVIETLDNIAVGGIVVTNTNYTNGTFAYGLGVGREYWRRGYASEAIRLLLNYYFSELRFNKCNVTVYDFNEGSKELHKFLGFTEEGRLRESKFSEGQYHDILYYGITAKEFFALHNKM